MIEIDYVSPKKMNDECGSKVVYTRDKQIFHNNKIYGFILA